MPNGADKNFGRLCCAIDGFRIRYKAWPTAVRLRAGIIADLRDHVLGPEALAKVEAKVRLIPDDALMIAEDGTGHTYNLEEQGYPSQEPDIRARDWLGVEAFEAVRYDRDMEAAVHLMSQPNYLGSPDVRERVLVELWNGSFTRRSSGTMARAAEDKADAEACENAARIFLGIDPGYTPVPAFNQPGVIDRHAATVLQIAEKDPVRCMTWLFLFFLRDLWTIVVAMEKSGIGPNQFRRQGAEGVFQKYMRTLTGLPPCNGDREVTSAEAATPGGDAGASEGDLEEEDADG